MLLSELYANKKVELFDMLNLDAHDTGLSKGYIYMSTKDASICTIKYSLKINDKNKHGTIIIRNKSIRKHQH